MLETSYTQLNTARKKSKKVIWKVKEHLNKTYGLTRSGSSLYYSSEDKKRAKSLWFPQPFQFCQNDIFQWEPDYQSSSDQFYVQ